MVLRARAFANLICDKKASIGSGRCSVLGAQKASVQPTLRQQTYLAPQKSEDQ